MLDRLATRRSSGSSFRTVAGAERSYEAIVICKQFAKDLIGMLSQLWGRQASEVCLGVDANACADLWDQSSLGPEAVEQSPLLQFTIGRNFVDTVDGARRNACPAKQR